MPMNVAPSGFPRCRSLWRLCVWLSVAPSAAPDASERKLELRRKSCVIAMPMDAKESEVRSQARKVRSGIRCQLRCAMGRGSICSGLCACSDGPRARWSRATDPLFSNSTLPHFSQNSLHRPPSLRSASSRRCCGLPGDVLPVVPSCGAAPWLFGFGWSASRV